MLADIDDARLQIRCDATDDLIVPVIALFRQFARVFGRRHTKVEIEAALVVLHVRLSVSTRLVVHDHPRQGHFPLVDAVEHGLNRIITIYSIDENILLLTIAVGLQIMGSLNVSSARVTTRKHV